MEDWSMERYLYHEMKWPEVREAAGEDRVVLQPIAVIEDHGLHLPVGADVIECFEVCRRAAERIPTEVVLMPMQWHGYSPHHMDFPGTITIDGPILIEYMLNITGSLALHGFRHILIINGHGSNSLWTEAVARLTTIRNPKVLCASVNFWQIPDLLEVAERTRRSGRGGVHHACEFETSLLLALRPDLVDMRKAVREVSESPSRYFPTTDAFQPEGAVRMMPWWSSMTKTGVMGDPTVATRENGERWLEAAINGLVGIVREFRLMKPGERRDHH